MGTKTKVTKPRAANPPNLDQILERWRKKCGPSGVKLAEKMVAKYRPEVITLAFRLLPKANTSRLSIREEKTYDDMKKLDPKVADRWKVQRLAEKAPKKK